MALVPSSFLFFTAFYSICWEYYPERYLCCKYSKSFWICCISNLCFLWIDFPCVCAISSSKLWLCVSCKCHRNLGLAGHSCSHLMSLGHGGCLCTCTAPVQVLQLVVNVPRDGDTSSSATAGPSKLHNISTIKLSAGLHRRGR